MLRPSEIVVDNFAGGGGASTGIRAAIGRDVDVAINHSPQAVAMHRMNHPDTEHLCQNVWKADPSDVARGRPVGLAWFSPDCRHFSKAKGGAPVSPRVRDLAWVVVLWARVVKPRVIMLENVEEFRTWGPLGEDGRPCPARSGMTFRKWVRELEREGYKVEHRELRACDYGAPTIRKRLFVIARRDGQPIVWPTPTHGPGTGRAYRTAAECIDWSIPCPSIFGRVKELADATKRRIAAGVMRYVVNAERPFCLVTRGYGEREGQAPRCHDINAPLGTAVAGGIKHGLVAAHIGYAQQGGASRAADAPLHTITASRKDQNQLVSAFLAQHNTGVVGHSMDEPMSTLTASGSHQQPVECVLSDEDLAGAERVSAFIQTYYGSEAEGQALDVPLQTITTKPRHALVMCRGLPIVDIGMRMLDPRELFRAQGFPDTYRIDAGLNEEGLPVTLTKTEQVRLVGNSVCPPLAEALVRANLSEGEVVRVAA